MCDVQADVDASRSECLSECASIHHKRRDYRRACVQFKEAVALDPKNQNVRGVRVCGVQWVMLLCRVLCA